MMLRCAGSCYGCLMPADFRMLRTVPLGRSFLKGTGMGGCPALMNTRWEPLPLLLFSWYPAAINASRTPL